MMLKKENTIHNSNWPKAAGYPYRILINWRSRSGKINSLFNLITHQPDIDKIYLYAKNPHETKYQLLLKKRESTGLKHFNDSKAFIAYSNNMNVIYKNLEEYNPNKKRNWLIVFEDIIADVHNKIKLNPIVAELLIKGRKLNSSLAFITQSYFAVPKSINSTNNTQCKITYEKA